MDILSNDDAFRMFMSLCCMIMCVDIARKTHATVHVIIAGMKDYVMWMKLCMRTCDG